MSNRVSNVCRPSAPPIRAVSAAPRKPHALGAKARHRLAQAKRVGTRRPPFPFSSRAGACPTETRALGLGRRWSHGALLSAPSRAPGGAAELATREEAGPGVASQCAWRQRSAARPLGRWLRLAGWQRTIHRVGSVNVRSVSRGAAIAASMASLPAPSLTARSRKALDGDRGDKCSAVARALCSTGCYRGLSGCCPDACAEWLRRAGRRRRRRRAAAPRST